MQNSRTQLNEREFKQGESVKLSLCHLKKNLNKLIATSLWVLQHGIFWVFLSCVVQNRIFCGSSRTFTVMEREGDTT